MRRPAVSIAVSICVVTSACLTACTSGGQAGKATSDAVTRDAAISLPSAARSATASPATASPTQAPASAPATDVRQTGASPTEAAVSAPATDVPSSAVPPTPGATHAAPPKSATAVPAFVATTSAVTAAQLGATWHAGCPIGPAQLRQITLSYWGFDGAPHTGTLVVNAAVTSAVVTVFTTLYNERFPIRSIRPVSEFGGSDDASMAVDNTSAFNCRYAVADGPPKWSAHAYGEAIDVNTIENPYLEDGKVLPPAGAPFAKRAPYRPGMAVPGGQLVKAFAAVGWHWGGLWTASPDYQHFSATGG